MASSGLSENLPCGTEKGAFGWNSLQGEPPQFIVGVSFFPPANRSGLGDVANIGIPCPVNSLTLACILQNAGGTGGLTIASPYYSGWSNLQFDT